MLQAGVVVQPLVVVTHALRFEKGQGQAQQLVEVVGKQVDVDAGGQIEADPPRNQAHAETAHVDKQLGRKDGQYQRLVLQAYSFVDQGLGEERSHERQEDAGKQSDRRLQHLQAEGPHVFAGKAPQAVACMRYFFFKECFGRLYGNGYALRAIQPTAAKVFFSENLLSEGRIGHSVVPLLVPPSPADTGDDYEMVLLPMENGRQRTHFAQLVYGQFETGTVQPNGRQRFSYASHAYALAREAGKRAEISEGVNLSVGRGNHADAGGPTVHLVELAGEFYSHLHKKIGGKASQASGTIR